MASSFDHEDKDSWYFGAIGRHEATNLLMEEREGGVFLVRDSATCLGDYVLCVKEDSKVSHYIINKTQLQDQPRYKIGDNFFKNIPDLLCFYKVHYLDTTPLIRPASKKVEKVIAKFDFDSKEKDDLSFKKGDILTILFKDEEQWWTARDKNGRTGSIPVPYVQKIEENHSPVEIPRPGSGGPASNISLQSEAAKRNQMQRKLPAKARVKQVRIPNAYDDTALKLEIGDVITVTKTNINGQWEGELNGKTGYFPFTHVEFLDEENES
ncbi:adapter molecule Crk [Diorhabda carinulata]|uniref:adapter molecule Crk n=1 Tax=Diorhabda sublineata TaxID=1163346 RepID=UPI0024E12327|nr:adapter molecule Crk [Diorhabda sublineata]XP_057662007.1 adapter molecule Crk [Diorhabda carinulata]